MKQFLFLMMCMLIFQASSQVNEKTRQEEENRNVPSKSNGNSNSNHLNNNLNNNSNFELEEKTIEFKKTPKSSGSIQKERVPLDKKSAQPTTVKSQEIQTVMSSFLTQKRKASMQISQRSPTPVQQSEMNQAVAYYATNASGSFEFHYFSYVAGNYDISLYPHLQKAQELRPTNSDVLIQLAAYQIIVNQPAKAATYLEQLKASGRIGEEVVDYDRDVLNSIPQNGVLITHGFDDTYGCLYLQQSQGFRKDVKVFSLDFMQSQAYRESLTRQGFAMPASKTIDVAFLNEFCRLNGNSNLHLGLTFPKPYFTPIVDKLQVLGLTFRYDALPESTLPENEKFWKEIVKPRMAEGAVTEKAKQLSSNYLPMLLYLRANYEGQKNKPGVAELDKVIDKIAVQSNKYSKVSSLKKKN